eukprot:EG_transcript_14912
MVADGESQKGNVMGSLTDRALSDARNPRVIVLSLSTPCCEKKTGREGIAVGCGSPSSARGKRLPRLVTGVRQDLIRDLRGPGQGQADVWQTHQHSTEATSCPKQQQKQQQQRQQQQQQQARRQ